MKAAEFRRAQLRGTRALAERESRRVVVLWTQTIVPAVVTGVLFLAVFGGELGPRIGEIEGVPYMTFILPGLLVMTVIGQAFANNSTSLFQSKSEGHIEDVLTSPLRAWQLAVAYMAGGLVRAFVATAAIAAIAIPFTGGVSDPALVAASLFLAGLIFASLGVITGVWAESFDQHAFVANLVVTPLVLLGGVFYSASALDEPWSTLTRVDPLFYLVDMTRAGFIGSHEATIWISVVVTAGFATITFAAATCVIASGWRLKP